MSDPRSLLERESRRFIQQDGAFERLVRRRDRKRRNQRIAAGVVGVAVFVAGIWIVTTGGAFDRTQTPAIRPTLTPEPAVSTPDRGPRFDRNVDEMCGFDPGAWCGQDYVLELENGGMTPLPQSIVWNGQNGYAISPDGSEVAYYGRPEDGRKGLFVAHLDGTQVRLIADGQPTQCCPHQGSPGWSPDGTKIAYVSRSDGDRNSNIFVVDIESGETTQATFETVDVSGIQFTPDGSSIIYTSYWPDGYQVRIVSVTGGEGSWLVGGHGSDASNAVLSPDGSVLSYSCDTHGGLEYDLDADLCLANADGSDPRVIVPVGSSFGILTASWSPDGSRLAYWTFHKWDVYILDVATGQRTIVGKGAWPSWLDDDTLIVEIYYGPA